MGIFQVTAVFQMGRGAFFFRGVLGELIISAVIAMGDGWIFRRSIFIGVFEFQVGYGKYYSI